MTSAHPTEVNSPALVAQLSREVALLTKALQSLHDVGCHAQAVLCALVDAHPAPHEAATIYEEYLTQLEATKSVPQGEHYTELKSAWAARFASAKAQREQVQEGA